MKALTGKSTSIDPKVLEEEIDKLKAAGGGTKILPLPDGGKVWVRVRGTRVRVTITPIDATI